jgi:hypothetical protein
VNQSIPNVGDQLHAFQLIPGLIIDTDQAIPTGHNRHPVNGQPMRRIAVTRVTKGRGTAVLLHDGVGEFEIDAYDVVTVVGHFNP